MITTVYVCSKCAQVCATYQSRNQMFGTALLSACHGYKVQEFQVQDFQYATQGTAGTAPPIERKET